MGGSTWIGLAIAIGGLLAITITVAAAYIAWLAYARQAKLKLYVGDEANQVTYEDGQAYVHATIANSGKVTAHDIFGRVEFEPAGRVYTDRRIPIDEHITALRDNWATLSLGSLPASGPQSAQSLPHAGSFEKSPKHFVIPVRVAKEGQTSLSYWFVYDETKRMEGKATLHFSEQTTS
jgi:hypothetical protein